MSKRLTADLDEQAQVLSSIASSTRLQIVYELSTCCKSVSELTEILGLDISTVSRHLSILKNSGVVSRSKSGIQVYYSLRNRSLLDYIEQLTTIAHNGIQRRSEPPQDVDDRLSERKRMRSSRRRRISKHNVIQKY